MSEGIGDTRFSDTRRRLLALSATVGFMLIVIVTVATYGMYRLDATVVANQGEIDRLAGMADDARVAQVTFKNQVQEWKDILLRGYDAADFKSYHEAFEARRADVRRQLNGLAAEAAALQFPTAEIEGLETRHEGLNAAYDDAMTAFKADDPLSVRAVDARVRGRDRPITTEFDALVVHVKSFADERRKQLRAETAAVAASMRRTLFASLAIGLAVLLVAAYMAMRAIGRP
jgi:methyl-accepting chemotaxis protein-1 (serine sensor receptor)